VEELEVVSDHETDAIELIAEAEPLEPVMNLNSRMAGAPAMEVNAGTPEPAVASRSFPVSTVPWTGMVGGSIAK
jgi:hypothetical protein